jgi:hypothetical protein
MLLIVGDNAETSAHGNATNKKITHIDAFPFSLKLGQNLACQLGGIFVKG